MSFRFVMPLHFAKGASMYSMVKARRPVKSTMQNEMKYASSGPIPYLPVSGSWYE